MKRNKPTPAAELVHKPTDREISFELLGKPSDGPIDDATAMLLHCIRIIHRMDDAIFNAAKDDSESVLNQRARTGLHITMEAVQALLVSSLANT